MSQAAAPTTPPRKNHACDLLFVESEDEIRDIQYRAGQMMAKLELLHGLFKHYEWAEWHVTQPVLETQPPPVLNLALHTVLQGLIEDGQIVLCPIIGKAEDDDPAESPLMRAYLADAVAKTIGATPEQVAEVLDANEEASRSEKHPT